MKQKVIQSSGPNLHKNLFRQSRHDSSDSMGRQFIPLGHMECWTAFHESDRFITIWEVYTSFLEELKARGYDTSTLKIRIEKKKD